MSMDEMKQTPIKDMDFKGRDIDTILDILWAIKNDDKHYFYSYGRDCLKTLIFEKDAEIERLKEMCESLALQLRNAELDGFWSYEASQVRKLTEENKGLKEDLRHCRESKSNITIEK